MPEICVSLCVLADRPHGPCKRTFLKSGLWVEKFESAALAFSCGQRICILCVRMMMPSPQPSTSGLRPLTPAKSHYNNNNGGLHACVCAAEDIEPIRVTRAKYSAPLPLRLAKKEYGQPASHFHLLLAVFGFSFYCLFVYSVQALCACSVSSSPFLVNFAPPIGWNMNYSMLSHLQWIHLGMNILEAMPRETGI